MGLRICRPGTHLVRMLARIGLDRRRGATVGVAFAQYRIDGATEDFAVAYLDRFLGLGFRGFGVIGHGVPLRLQFLDRGLELWHGGADVRLLDDVGFGFEGQLAEFRQAVDDFLGVAQVFRKAGQNAPGERNIACLDRHACRPGEGLDDRQQRVGRQCRGFVNQGVINCWRGHGDPLRWCSL